MLSEDQTILYVRCLEGSSIQQSLSLLSLENASANGYFNAVQK
jgi:hypothetical protein